MAGEASQERGLSSPTCDVQRWAEREVKAGQARDSGSAVRARVRVVFRAPQGTWGGESCTSDSQSSDAEHCCGSME